MPSQTSSDNLNANSTQFVWVLSLIAITPMVALAIFLVLIDPANVTYRPLLDAFKTGSAILLSFTAGARWGLELRQTPHRSVILILSLLPAACGWISLFLTEPFSIALLLITYCALGAWDSLSFNGEINAKKHHLVWYANIRTVMTLIMALVHGAVLLAVLN